MHTRVPTSPVVPLPPQAALFGDLPLNDVNAALGELTDELLQVTCCCGKDVFAALRLQLGERAASASCRSPDIHRPACPLNCLLCSCSLTFGPVHLPFPLPAAQRGRRPRHLLRQLCLDQGREC